MAVLSDSWLNSLKVRAPWGRPAGNYRRGFLLHGQKNGDQWVAWETGSLKIDIWLKALFCKGKREQICHRRLKHVYNFYPNRTENNHVTGHHRQTLTRLK